MLTRILNSHPQVFITSETDVLWILYQFYNSIEYKTYPYDGPVGMNLCLQRYEERLDIGLSIFENFVTIQTEAMNDGFFHFEPVRRTSLKYIGDKKPFQNADPILLNFIKDDFPPPVFIHLIRHPFSVVRSCKEFGGDGKGDFMWGHLTAPEILDHWTLIESWIEELKIRPESNIHTIRYEDLVTDPVSHTETLFDFLDLEYTHELVLESTCFVRKNSRSELSYPSTSSLRLLAERYGYKI